MESPHSILKKVFGYDSFRPGQEEIVSRLLAGQDVLAVMPTGAGKSICYQVPALLLPGITIVVSPLVSLMKDQVGALVQAGVAAAFLNNSLTDNQKALMLRRAREGWYKIIYVAPERLEMPGFQRFAQEREISMVTVDEAHCISQWGQDFRPSYLRIKEFVDSLPSRPVMGAFTATATALRGLPEDGSTADIVEGETLTVEQLLYCMLVISANETCNILGETLCGSVDAFVERMNQRAQELGCKNTHFANTTGLTQSGHYSSAYDLYLITREAMKHEDFMTMVNTKSYEIPPTNKTEEERVLHSTNALISNWRLAGYLYSGAQGIKTGSTDAAGQCLVSSAVRGSRTLISVVLGAERVTLEDGVTILTRSFSETSRMFDWGFDNFAPQQVLDENELIQEVPVALSKQVSTVAVHPAESADAMLPKDLDVSALTRTVTLDNETALAPIAAGDRLGEITVSYGDTTYVTVPLLAVADVSASRFLSLRHAIGEFFSQRSARIAVLALVVLVAALVLWFRFYGRNRRYGKPGSKQYRHHSYRGRRH